MKQLIVLVLVLTAAIATHAQTDSIYVWNKWCARKDTLLLFNTGNNVIQVYCRGMKPADFKLKSLDMSLRIGAPEIKGDTMSVLAMPYPGKGRHMRLAVLSSKGRQLKVLEFASDNIPAPTVRIGTLAGNEAAKKDILSQSVLRVVFPRSLYAYPYQVKQYGFKIQTPKGSASLNASGFWIAKDMQAEISNAPEGTTFTLTNIKVTCPECATRSVDDVKMKIK